VFAKFRALGHADARPRARLCGRAAEEQATRVPQLRTRHARAAVRSSDRVCRKALMLRAVTLVIVLGWSALVVHAEAVSPVIVPPAATEPAADAEQPLKWLPPPRQLTVQLPGMSHHFDDPVDSHGNPMPGREFNERNWGIGIQLERALTGEWSQWVSKVSFGVMKDSLDAMGLYAGYTWQKRLLDTPTYSVDLGGGGFLFWRTLEFDGPHLLVPAVLPVLSAEWKSLRLGVNVVAVPRCQFSGGTMPGVVYLQFTKAF